MAIEDTFGYRFVRTSLVMLNCIVLLRLLSLLLQYSHVFEPTFVIFILFIGANFMIAIVGAVREHRVSVILTGSATLIMFLSMIFAAKENKGVNIFLLLLLAIAVQSLIFSEMLKERQTLFAQRQNLNYLSNLSGNNRNLNNNSTNGPVAAVVVYQTPGSNRPAGTLFMVDPEIGSELAKDPPPSYFASNCPPPKYEDAIKLNAGDLSLPAVANEAETTSPDQNPISPSSLPSNTSVDTPNDGHGTSESSPSPSGSTIPSCSSTPNQVDNSSNLNSSQ
ncbi:hypothetical protein RDWZM_007761 [Blomia tropicalis]|uniref:Uncharacterized protein n=1 Tax=Blomia tropicalis TaxID=40697 RepID=A0A9Q0M0D8_BLOTA|nr:hypothetical protein RDWZM_007761 [Blomia tropicalis]